MYDNELKGVLFKNNKKEKEQHPDYKGQATIEGKEYWVSSWINTNKEGNKYMALNFQLKENQQQAPKESEYQTLENEADDVPF